MRIIELHIETENVARSLEFYRQLLPHKRIVGRADDDQVFLTLEDGGAFGIWRKGYAGLFNGRAAAHLHYALQVDADQLPELKEKLNTLNTPYTEHTWKDGHQSVYFFDPDGHQGEFITKDWLGRPDGSPFGD